jgi:hypothetical protein
MRRVLGTVNIQEKGGVPNNEVCRIINGVLCPCFSRQTSLGFVYEPNFRGEKRAFCYIERENFTFEGTMVHSVKF